MYNEALNFRDKTPFLDAWATLYKLEKYVNGATIQGDRIQADRKELDRDALQGVNPGVDRKLMLTLFLDIHFYFICCDKVQNLLESFVELDGDPKLKKLWRTMKPKLKIFNDARNILEHIEKEIRKENLSDLGNLQKDAFTFGGKSYDISESRLKSLTDAYEQVVSILSKR
ncbi:hypothetical protein KKA69_01765 [Patescibacteria group bacterium]|nr:hypothetical protein [Patescibacteria group bacterium]